MIRSNYLFSLENNKDNILTFSLQNSEVKAYIFVLEEDIIRFMLVDGQPKLGQTWWVAPGQSDIEKEGISKFDIGAFSKPRYDVLQEDGYTTIETSKIKVTFCHNSMKAVWVDKATGNVFASDRKTQNINIQNSMGEGVFHYLQRSLSEEYYGLGERTGEVNRHGRRYKMMNVDPMGYNAKTTDPLYKHVPFYITRNTETGFSFGIFYDNMSTSEFDMGNELDNYHGYYRYYNACDGDLDYYIILGPTIADVTKKFSWLTGKTIMPPKWSIGYSGSTMTYTDAPDAQTRLLEFVALCKKHNMPCDSFQLSSGYTSIGNKRYVFNWNLDKVPNPSKLSDDFHSNGLRLCANIKPCLLWDHPMFEELKQEGLFIRSADGSEVEMCQFWDEIGAYIDFTNPKAFDWWKNKVKEQLLSYGIDSTWNDNNEYEVWDKKARVCGFGNETNIENVKPLQTLLMMMASYEAQKEYAPSVRPYLISRSGCPGMQRYVQTWSGDNRTNWETLKYNIKMGIGLSLSGIYNFGHDVGGFSGNAPEPELFLRWVQNGIFHPRFTIHSWNDDKTVNEPWMYPEVLDDIRSAIELRSKLTPFFYDLLYKAHTSYEPMVRPTFYNFENDAKTFEENDDFMLSDVLLVASVVENGQRSRSVYLPICQEGWFEYNSGKYFDGGQTVTVDAPLHQVPFFLKGGAILPINTANITFEMKNHDERAFLLYPVKGAFTSSYLHYEDDGYTRDFEKGIFTTFGIKMETTETEIILDIEKNGEFALPYKTIKFYVPKNETRKIVLAGNDQTYEKNNDEKFVTYVV